MRTIRWTNLTMILAALTIGGLAIAGENAEDMMADLPQAARHALLREAAGAKIDKVERETEDGVTVYEAEWTANGSEHEAAVTEDGSLVETEEEITLNAAPAAVRAVAAEQFGADAKVKVERKMVVVYELESRANGKEIELHVLATGRVLNAADNDDGDANEADDD